MNRRSFLKSILIGSAVAAVPASAIEEDKVIFGEVSNWCD